ncbi:MAG: hypothetical protein AAF658_19460, partial [Myxococcota bacterium]
MLELTNLPRYNSGFGFKWVYLFMVLDQPGGDVARLGGIRGMEVFFQPYETDHPVGGNVDGSTANLYGIVPQDAGELEPNFAYYWSQVVA